MKSTIYLSIYRSIIKPWFSYVLLFLFFVSSMSLFGQNYKGDDPLEIKISSFPETIIRDGMEVRKFDNVPTYIFNIYEKTIGQSAEERAKNYILNNKELFGVNDKFDNILKFKKHHQTSSGDVVSFRQYYRDLEVDLNEIVIKINTDGFIVNVFNSTSFFKEKVSLKENVSTENCDKLVMNYFGINNKDDIKFEEKTKIVHLINNRPYIAYRIILKSLELGNWIGFIDVSNGKILGIEKSLELNCLKGSSEFNILNFENNERNIKLADTICLDKNNYIKKSSCSNPNAKIFMPDPLTSSGKNKICLQRKVS